MARPADADSAETCERILRAAREQLDAHGAESFVLRRIAADAGVGMGTLHYYFKDRQGLLEATLDPGYRWIEQQTRSSLSRVGSGVPVGDEVETLVRLWFRGSRKAREHIRLRSISTLRRGALSEKILRDELLRTLDRVADQLGFDRGNLPLRFAAHSLELLIARYVLHTDEECCAITLCEKPDEAWQAVEDHLVYLGRELFEAPLAD